MISDKISSFPAIARAEEAVVTSSSTVDCATAVGTLALHLRRCFLIFTVSQGTATSQVPKKGTATSTANP